MSANASASAKEIQSHYTGRAANYDDMNGGWHIQLGKDFVKWLFPTQGGSVALELACGTGLVTIPLASAIGPAGKLFRVDLTKAMLDQARWKALPTGSAPIEWNEHDIMNLSVVLEPGGRIITDVPTEDKILQYIVTVERKDILRLPDELDRSWIKGAQSLSTVFEEAGLTVVESYSTRNHVEALGTKMYDGSEGQRVWEEHVEKLTDFVHLEEERGEDAKETYLKIWEKNLGQDGKFRDGNSFCVVVEKKE